MFLQIENLLTNAEVQTVADIARQARFIDGRRSNPHNVTKDSVIVDPADPLGQQASQIAATALQRSDEVREFVFPRRIALPSLVRYGVGMKYGPHTDAAYLSIAPEPLRSDVSCTIWLADPGSYQGGELIAHFGSELVRLKGKPGSAVFYPSTTIHQVMPVTSGERLVFITFIESMIPDQLQRDLLYALGEVRALEAAKMDWRNRTQLDYVIQNLQRLWSV
jgi:PKHD-type hydroxylase